MKAVVHHTHGGPEVLRYEDVGDPIVGRGDVLVEVRAAALNRLDILQRSGPPLVPGFELPHIAGMDLAGVVVASGGHDLPVEVGDRVVVNPSLECGECSWCRRGDDAFCPTTRIVGANRPGGYAELCSVPASHVFALPDNVDFEHAATIPTAFSSAWQALVARGELRAGETLLVHAAGSGVSVAAIQLAKRCGATVVATSGSDEKLAQAAKLGADVLVNNKTQDIEERAREATAGRGVDVAFDHVGPAFFEASIRSLRPGGRLLFSGTTSGTTASFNLPYAYHFGISLLGVQTYSAREFARMLEFYWAGGFEAVIDTRFRLSDAAAAQERLETGESFGKILLLP